MIELFISAGEPSGDLQGEKLISSLLAERPNLKIGAVAGPKMRALNISPFFAMEDLQVMGFIDVFFALPKLFRQFYAIRKKILELKPKAVVCIDYPGFHLRLERSLRKKGYQGKLIHFVCPTVWAWGKKRILLMEKNLDLLLTIFPFEKKCFANGPLAVEYVGHPLVDWVHKFSPSATFRNRHKIPDGSKILSLFPGSRDKEIERNFNVQISTARRLKALDPSLCIAISCAHPRFEKALQVEDAILIPPQETYDLMHASHLALATSGTVTLELALHKIPTVVHFAIHPLDLFLAQKIFKINLPFYCIVNIILEKQVFPELFGPNFTEGALFKEAKALLLNEEVRKECLLGCLEVLNSLNTKDFMNTSAKACLFSMDF